MSSNECIIRVDIPTGRVLEDNLHAFWETQSRRSELPDPVWHSNPAMHGYAGPQPRGAQEHSTAYELLSGCKDSTPPAGAGPKTPGPTPKCTGWRYLSPSKTKSPTRPRPGWPGPPERAGTCSAHSKMRG